MSALLARLYWSQLRGLMRAIGILVALWAALQLVANAFILFGVFPSSAASWLIPTLLGASALQDVLIAVLWILLSYMAALKNTLQVYRRFTIFVSRERSHSSAMGTYS